MNRRLDLNWLTEHIEHEQSLLQIRKLCRDDEQFKSVLREIIEKEIPLDFAIENMLCYGHPVVMFESETPRDIPLALSDPFAIEIGEIETKLQPFDIELCRDGRS